MAKFFQDLSGEQQGAIWEGLRKDLWQEAKDEGLKCNNEYIDDYINRNNSPSQVAEWLEQYWFEDYFIRQ